MDKVKLLPCPFCGKGAAIGAIASVPPRYFVNCTMCQATVGEMIGYCRQEDATSAWNTRPPIVTDEVVERAFREGYGIGVVVGVNQGDAGPICEGKVLDRAWKRSDARAALAAMPTIDQDGGVTESVERGVSVPVRQPRG